jgi:putative ABC transport system permease protein
LRQLRAALLRLIGLTRRPRYERELADELMSHLDLHVDANLRAGMSPAEARRRALIVLGGIDQTKERYRERRGLPLVENVLRDARHGMRTLRRSPGFTATAVLTLMLGIGANTAIFSVAHALLVEPVAGLDLDRLAAIVTGDRGLVAPADYVDLRTEARSFEEIAAYRTSLANLTGDGMPERIASAGVTGNFFRALDREAALGRTFVEADDVDGGDVAIVSHRLWQQRFGEDPGLVGRRIYLDGRPHLVIGIMPVGLEFPNSTDVWVPLGLSLEERAERRFLRLRVVGRLPQDVALSTANAEVSAITVRLERAHPGLDRVREVRAMPLAELIQGTITRRVVILLLVAVAVVLAAACTNIAGLQLSRVTARDREIAIRTALGAGRWRVFQLLIWENICLAIVAAVFSLIVARVWLWLLVSTVPPQLARLLAGWTQIDLDWRAFVVTGAATLVSGVLCGLAPAWSACHMDPQGSLKEGARTASSGFRLRRLRSAFVTGQIAVAFVLVVAAGFFVQGVRGLFARGDIHDPAHVAVFSVTLSDSRYATAESRSRFYSDAVARLAQLPGAQAAAAFSAIPLSNNGVTWHVYEVEGAPRANGALAIGAVMQAVSPDFFSLMQIPIQSGRRLAYHDRADGQSVVVVSEALARRHWPDGGAIGKRIRLGTATNQGSWLLIVGVAGDVLYDWTNRVPEPVVYTPIVQTPTIAAQIAVRAPNEAAGLFASIREQLAALDPLLPAAELMSLDAAIGVSLSGSRQIIGMFSTLGALALMIALVGVYGLTAYAVAGRRREFGIRLALGATRRHLLALALRGGGTLALAGLVLGFGVALVLEPALSTSFFGVVGHSAATLVALALLLIAANALACYVPARRATTVDPIVTLKAE